MNETSSRRCGTMARLHHLLELYPEFRANLVRLEEFTTQCQMQDVRQRAARVARIPVVVHVIYCSDAENVSDAQVRSQVEVLNEDFRALNANRSRVPAVWSGLVADARIEFALASSAPDGTPASGILRVKTYRSSFAPDDSAKFFQTGGSDAWPTDRYLNLWVCNQEQFHGYAQLPGGPSATDGVVVRYDAFGREGTARRPFNLGRTATHQVAHWLNLYHVWGDSPAFAATDLVEDTPPSRLPNSGEPQFPHLSGPNGPNGDMFVNYMDYVDDSCMCMFTPQQACRMQAALEHARPGVAGQPSARQNITAAPANNGAAAGSCQPLPQDHHFAGNE